MLGRARPRISRKLIEAGAALVLSSVLWAPAAMADEPTFELAIHGHRFQPESLDVPAHKRIKLVIRNTDPTPEEFETYKQNREKVIPRNSTATVFIGPLDAGTYPFVGEFHAETAKGSIVAK